MRSKYYFEFIPKFGAYLIHQLSKLSIRKKNKWVFGCHFGYADNPKYFFLDVCINHPEIQAIWISHKMEDVKLIRKNGFKAYYWFDFRGLYHALTSKVWISARTIIDINRFFSGGSVYVNLHHGVGLKKCYWQRPQLFANVYDITEDRMKDSFLFKIIVFPYLFRVADLCLVTSHSQGNDFVKPQYRITDENCIHANAPRNKILTQSKDEIIKYVSKYEYKASLDFLKKLEKYNKVYIYMPTWRDNGENFIQNAHIDFEQLDNVLKQNGNFLIMKLHPFTKIDIKQIKSCKNICCYPSGVDLYTVLPFTDCIITDYSSVYTDAVYMNKEIILYIFDYKKYMENCHDLGDYDTYYRGTRVFSFTDLLNIIVQNTDCHLSEPDRELLMDYYWEYANNGINIVSEIKNRIGWKTKNR